MHSSSRLLKLRMVWWTPRTRTWHQDWGQCYVNRAPSNLTVGYVLHKQTTHRDTGFSTWELKKNSTSLGEKRWVSKCLSSLCDRLSLPITVFLKVPFPLPWLWEIWTNPRGSIPERHKPKRSSHPAALKVMAFPAHSPVPHSSPPAQTSPSQGGLCNVLTRN